MIRELERLQSPDYQKKLAQCIHCGLCLQACPTYAVFGTEMDGPRGRIALMRALSEGGPSEGSPSEGSPSEGGPSEGGPWGGSPSEKRASEEAPPAGQPSEGNNFSLIHLEEILEGAAPHLQLCLACRACESACPSGVRYGALIEEARIVMETNRTPGPGERFLRWLGTDQLMAHPGRLKWAARLLWVYQASGLQRVVRGLNFLPKTLNAMEAILPPITPHYADTRRPAPALGDKRGRVLFFSGCIQEGFLAPVNQATMRVLQRNGYEVVTPGGQTCCGAAHLHLGEADAARRLARQNIDAFLNTGEEFQAVLCNAGGCGLALKEYPHLLTRDPQYAGWAQDFAARVQDVSEFLAAQGWVPPEGRVDERATYADSCHLRHGQKVVRQPRQLLQAIPGLELVELSQPERCCGSAGVYNITQVEAANAILDAKMADIAATGAQIIVTSNTGCHMQLIAGVRRAGLKARVMHVMEVLDEAYG